MPIHDRSPAFAEDDDKFANGKYVALFRSDHYRTLELLAGELAARWRVEQSTGLTLDDYTMASLKRDGKIEGVIALILEIKRLANLSTD